MQMSKNEGEQIKKMNHHVRTKQKRGIHIKIPCRYNPLYLKGLVKKLFPPLFLINRNLDMYMARLNARLRTRLDVLQPVITIILILRITIIMVNTMTTWRSFNTRRWCRRPTSTVGIHLTSAEQSTCFALSLEQICKSTP